MLAGHLNGILAAILIMGFYLSMAGWVGRVAPSRADWISLEL